LSLFWIAAVLVMLLTVLGVAWPLLRKRSVAAPERADQAVALYRRQLAEVDRDLERGVIAPAEAQALSLEIKRRILAEAPGPNAPAAVPSAISPRRHLAVLAVCLGLSAAGFGLYAELGSPGVPDQPLAARIAGGDLAPSRPEAADRLPPPEVAQAITALAERLKTNPDDVEGWALLGRAYLSMGRYAEGSRALGEAFGRSGRRPNLAADYGESLVAAAGGRVTNEAADAFEIALDRDRADPRGRYYLSLARAQQGDIAGALQGWIDLLALAPADAPWIGEVRARVDQAASALGLDPATLTPSADAEALRDRPVSPGPSAEDMDAAAAMGPEDREAMIRGMVERLAARLEAEPDDREGWLRLARAYDVLGEAEKARDARARADRLGP
jgi:cytochrome c-type biogenesis protein CcmH